jgi:hypothetical protein
VHVRLLALVAICAVLLSWQARAPGADPLAAAEEILKSVKPLSIPGGRAQLLAAPAAPRPVGTSPTAGKKLCYICWFGDFGAYGGATREEALKDARAAKRLNPDTRIKVTEHLASPSMTIDAIKKTPGKVILELP